MKAGGEKTDLPLTTPPRRSAWLAAALSLLPGAGHLYIGKMRKGAALLVIDTGILLAIFFSKSLAIALVMVFPYLILMIPAVVDTFCLARGGVNRFGESRLYLIILLLTKGFWVLPLLWHSHAFSKRAKIAWSIAVPLLALIYFSLIFFYGRAALEYAEVWLG